MSRFFVVLGLVLVWSVGAGPAASQTVSHRTYALRGYSVSDRYQAALVMVRDRLIAALQDVHALPPGFPHPCRFRIDPPQQPGVVSRLTPEVSVATDPVANGILLDSEGHYLMLGVADFPDARLHLFVVFLVPDSAGLVLAQADRETLPRIVIGFPVLGGSQYPALLDALRQGLRDAGAYEISFR